jgi:hypothetical protein
MCDKLGQVYESKSIIFDLIHERYKADRISVVEGHALEAAVAALEEQHGDTQDVRILAYIAKNAPYVYLFRDAYTMRALRAGFEALQNKEERIKAQWKQTNSL